MTAGDIKRQTEEIQNHNTSDTTRWRDIFLPDPHAIPRATIAAGFITSGKSLLDIGAGAQCLKNLLPAPIKYHAVDIIPQSADCIIHDLNHGTYPAIDTAWVTFLNIIEFLHHTDKILQTARRHAQNMILSYDRRDHHNDKRKTHGYFNDYSQSEIEAIITRAGWKITHCQMEKETIYFVCS